MNGRHVIIGSLRIKYSMNCPTKLKIIVTHCDDQGRRSNNIKQLKSVYGDQLTVLHAIDALAHEHHLQKIITEYKIPTHMSQLQKKTIGKLGCWLSLIMTVKYIYDVIDEDVPVLVLQDDVLIPKDFDFMSDHWSIRNKWYKLTQWNEAFIIDKQVAKTYLQLLYSNPISWQNSDRWIMEYIDPQYIKNLWCKKPRLGLLDPTNRGLIKTRSKKIHKYKWGLGHFRDCNDPGSLVNRQIFKATSDTNFINTLIS